jgi:hypothetical protein
MSTIKFNIHVTMSTMKFTIHVDIPKQTRAETYYRWHNETQHNIREQCKEY